MDVSVPGGDPVSLALFCKVVDNFGDIGICWRLALQLQAEHGVAVTLWVDDLHSFKRIAPAVQVGQPMQHLENVTVRHWQGDPGPVSAADIPDIVIEFFGCDIPETYIAAMAQCSPRPVWLNLEGLTAQTWVEGCHTLSSPYPRLPLTKYFFYPGFTGKTGGLLRERGLQEQRQGFQTDPAAMKRFLATLGVTPAEAAGLTLSLFCYPHAPVTDLLAALAAGTRAVTCLVPDGVAPEPVARFLGAPMAPGAVRTRDALTLRVVPFLPQADYDRLLWACDVNFVRGEDSFVRAQWAGRPFLWHIYPQDKNLHHVKLQAFLDRLIPGAEATTAMLQWNGAIDASGEHDMSWASTWENLATALPAIETRVCAWRRHLLGQPDLATQLLSFAAAQRAAGQENRL